MSLIYEICIDSVEGAVAAEGAGAQRVELCAGLFEGGITPSLGMITSVREAAGSIKLHVMIRPRGGDFIYSEHEVAVMERDVAAARDAGAHGLVIGALTAEGRVDRPTTARLMRAAGDLPITFHRCIGYAAHPPHEHRQDATLGAGAMDGRIRWRTEPHAIPSGLCGAGTSSGAIPATLSGLRGAGPTTLSAIVPAPPAMIAVGAVGWAAGW